MSAGATRISREVAPISECIRSRSTGRSGTCARSALDAGDSWQTGEGMRVVIDATPLLVRSAGVKNYLYHWILHMRRMEIGRAHV